MRLFVCLSLLLLFFGAVGGGGGGQVVLVSKIISHRGQTSVYISP